MAHPTFTIAEALALIDKLGSQRRAAEALGVTPSAVSARLRRGGVDLPDPTGHRRKAGYRYTDEDRERAIDMYVDGVPVLDIAARMGCNKNTIVKWMKSAGVELRISGPRTHVDPAEARRLYERLGSQRDVAYVLGVSRSTVWRALERAS